MNEDIEKLKEKLKKILENYEIDKKIGQLSVDSIYHMFPTESEALLNYLEQLQNNWNELKEENKALLTLVEWFIECGMGFDNIASPDDMNWEEFEEESKNMGYTESLIYYAKKYNQLQELEQGKDE